MGIKYETINSLNTSERFKIRILDKIKQCLEHKEELKFTEIYLFGSVARSNERYNSDIDLMLVTENPVGRETKSLLYMYEIFDEFEADVLLRSKETLNKENYFNENFHKDKILIYME